MKVLVVYYSRTGNTEKVAHFLREKLGANEEKIVDTVDRSGIKGYLISGRDAIKRVLTKLEPLKSNPAEYEMVLVGTPVWGRNVSTPVRTYLFQNKGLFSKIAFFCTMGGMGSEKTFTEMEKIIGQEPVATLAIKTRDVVSNTFPGQADQFLMKIKNEK